MTSKTYAEIAGDELNAFKAKWPCYGLPDSLHRLGFYFDHQGDLVDIVADSDKGRAMDPRAFDGPALCALADDARAKCFETPREVRTYPDPDGRDFDNLGESPDY